MSRWPWPLVIISVVLCVLDSLVISTLCGNRISGVIFRLVSFYIIIYLLQILYRRYSGKI